MRTARHTNSLVQVAVRVRSLSAKEQRVPNWWTEVAGGALGGYVGGLLPDVLEPAISSWHRDVAHSCAAGGGIVALGNALRN